MANESAGPLTDLGFWDAIWKSNPGVTSPRPPDIRLMKLFGQLLGPGSGRSLIELGCGNSRWLPYFASLGYRVTGVDYSEAGCASAERNLSQSGTQGEIFKRDIFDANLDIVGHFDVVFSYGLAEHFADTGEAFRQISRFAAPQGLVLTEVPNMTGIPGLFQRLVGPEIAMKHRALDTEDLQSACQAALMEVQWVGYCGTFDPYVVNETDLPRLWRLLFNALRRGLSTVVEPCLRLFPKPPESRICSPYLAILGRVS